MDVRYGGEFTRDLLAWLAASPCERVEAARAAFQLDGEDGVRALVDAWLGRAR